MSVVGDLPVAGTVVILRPGDAGIEALLLRRPERGSFANAWVFPGGKVEESDRVPGAAEIDDARRAGIRETREEVGLDVDDLVPLSLWEPPEEAPTRIRTWFFLATAPAQELVPAPDEVVEARWIAPAAALDLHAAGEWTLFPPTWMTLHRLRGHTGVGAALAAAGAPPVYRTRIVDSPAGRSFHWEDESLDTARLPWRVRRRHPGPREREDRGEETPTSSGPFPVAG
ncbi:NUDIX hydrolase [Microbacterium sp. XT11]|uniref:NUDIX hydrolase n=1 Tax=Microbacterium sp. XT11 TaxID=367477 RepID=UPI0009F85870|nr:NUDIX domain-containing protein [Microbacterium sp. XT11]